jgi:GT2 family glycosyltransferase
MAKGWIPKPVPEPAPEGFAPVRMVEMELSQPLSDIEPTTSSSGATYERALVLVRLHAVPLALLETDLPDGALAAGELVHRLWRETHQRIASHMRADRLPVPQTLTPAGLGSEEEPACVRARRVFLTHAPAMTVLIPSRERPERLRRCLESILRCAYPPERLQVLVVDNAPTSNATHELLESYRQAGAPVRYAREDAPGSASARNRGLSEVESELVAMTDDDVIVDEHWLAAIAQAFAAYPQASCVTGLLLPADLDTPPQLWFEQYGGFSRGFDRRVFDLRANRPVGESVYPWTAGIFGTGNNFSFRTEALREIGGFDPALGNGTPALGGVDSEMLLRTILSGHTIVYEPEALVHHAHRPDYSALRRQVHAYGAGLSAYYLKTILAEPRFLIDFLRVLPAGLRFMFSADSHINKHKQTDYPSELTWLERRGILYGPLAYARSRRRYGPHPVYRHLRRTGPHNAYGAGVRAADQSKRARD